MVSTTDTNGGLTMRMLATVLALAGSTAQAQVLHEGMAVGGILCDTQEQVTEFISVMNAQGREAAINAIKGCGVLAKPTNIRIVAMGTHTHGSRKFLIVKYQFLEIPMPDQFGIGAVVEISSI